jgi:hypothetical protein
MALIDTVFSTLHLLYGGLWTGAVLFFVWQVRPLVADGTLSVEAADRLASGLQWLTRGGVLVFLATGGHMAANIYPGTALIDQSRGHVVLTMLVSWLVLTGLVEAGAGKMRRELDAGRLRTAGKSTRGLFLAAGGFALLLLVLGGYLA